MKSICPKNIPDKSKNWVDLVDRKPGVIFPIMRTRTNKVSNPYFHNPYIGIIYLSNHVEIHVYNIEKREDADIERKTRRNL